MNLKLLNNTIIEWENLYGFWYNECYNKDGTQKKFRSKLEEEQCYQNLRECRIVMEVLHKLKRNRFYIPKKSVKRKYKIGD